MSYLPLTYEISSSLTFSAIQGIIWIRFLNWDFEWEKIGTREISPSHCAGANKVARKRESFAQSQNDPSPSEN